MSSPEDAIRRVVEAFERSDWSEIDVRWGNVRVHLSTSALVGDGATSSSQQLPAADLADRAQPDGWRASRAAPAPAPASRPSGAHVVVSPSPGIFWRSPEPGLPPFADVGDLVEASATVCIVEVMKLMNHVKAGVAGTVVAVLRRERRGSPQGPGPVRNRPRTSAPS